MAFRIRFLSILTHQMPSKCNTKDEETRTNCGKGQVERKNGGPILLTIHFTVPNMMLLESTTRPSAGHPKECRHSILAAEDLTHDEPHKLLYKGRAEWKIPV